MDAQSDKRTNTVVRLLQDLFEVGAVYHRGHELVCSLNYRFDRQQSLRIVEDRLSAAGYTFRLDDRYDELLLTIDPKPKLRIPAINIILFLATLVSVYLISILFRFYYGGAEHPFRATWEALGRGEGIEFTLALMSILFVHEMGHFVASRRRGIVTSWPYFIPAPTLIGTFGAIIKSKSPFWNRRDLIEVGAAGPIAGWIVAVFWLLYGLSQSAVLPPEAFSPGVIPFSLMGESILMKISALYLIGPAPAGYVYVLSEAAFAGWVGLLVTALNLLPIGQLDGGHILYGLGPSKQKMLGMAAMAALLVLGLRSPMWWFFALFGIVFGIKHPPTLNDRSKPGKTATAMAVISIIIMIVSFTPIPFQ